MKYPGENHNCLTAGQVRTLENARRSERRFALKERIADGLVVTFIVGLLVLGFVLLALSFV